MAFVETKRAFALDLVLVMIVFITVLSIIVIAAYALNSKIITAVEDSGSGLNTSSMNSSRDALQMFNSGIPFIFFGFIIVSLLVAVYLRTSPVISIFLIIILAVIGYVAQGVSNGFMEFAANSEMSAAANEFEYVVYLENNLPIIILIAGFAILIFYFAKPKQFAV